VLYIVYNDFTIVCYNVSSKQILYFTVHALLVTQWNKNIQCTYMYYCLQCTLLVLNQFVLDIREQLKQKVKKNKTEKLKVKLKNEITKN